MRRAVTTLAAALSLGGAVACSTTAGPGGAVTETAADVLISVEEENRLGDEMAAEIERELELLDDPEVVSYVEELGRTAAAQAEDTPAGIEYTFHVIDDPETVNAFAIPGGHVYVFTGLLAAAEDEAELMAVLSHEAAHVAERHVPEQLVAQYGLQALQQLAFGRDPGLLGRLVGTIGSQGYLLKNSRDAEREADAVGFDYLVAADYDPNGFVSFFQRLEEEGAGAEVPTFLLTHPPPEDRIEAARERIEELPQVPGTRNRERYEEMKANLSAAG